MAIVNRTSNPTENAGIEHIVLEINNGDLSALNTIKESWNFKDQESVFRFALAILIQAEDNKVYVNRNGKKVSMTPADSLIIPVECNPAEEE